MVTDIDTIIDSVSGYWSAVDRDTLMDAYQFAAQAHQGQQRLTGEPYITHPLQVANILVMLQADPTAVAAALLHDTLEDTDTNLEEITQRFGPEIGRLVQGVTKLRKLDFSTRQQQQARNLRKMFLAMADDIRVILIKLADRLHNMRTLSPLPPEKQQATATETLHIFAPLAHRLGIWRLKWELEDRALKYLEPDTYWQIVESLGQTREQREAQLEAARHRLEEALHHDGVSAQVEGRAKHIYSIYEKMRHQHIDFSQIADLMALRVITETVSDCYAALGLVHSLWMPVPGMFTDYIAKPKSNRYQSLHTKVIGPHKQPLEVQIRTEQMHRRAQYGVAAHWRYKGDADPELDQQVSWLRQLVELETDLQESHEFLELLQLDLFQDQVFVFTPDGDVIDLPRGATPVDFAYHIHTEVGRHCTRAKVNGQVVALDYPLENGDICEIVTSPNAQPNRDWLRFIQSSRAKAKVRKFLRDQTQQQNIEIGRRQLEQAIQKLPAAHRAQLNKDKLPAVAQHLNYADTDGLLAAIGYGEVQTDTIISHLRGDELHDRPQTLREEVQLHLPEAPATPGVREGMLVTADGMQDLHSRLSKCCNPLPGDDIAGYITRGRGMTIHRSNCKNLLYRADKEPNRIVPLKWATGPEQPAFRTNIEIVAGDRVGLLSHITAIISDCDINIAAATTDATSGEFARLHLTLDIHQRRDLEQLIDRLQKLIDVVSVRQVGS